MDSTPTYHQLNMQQIQFEGWMRRYSSYTSNAKWILNHGNKILCQFRGGFEVRDKAKKAKQSREDQKKVGMKGDS